MNDFLHEIKIYGWVQLCYVDQVTIQTGWTTEESSSNSGRAKNFLFSMSSRPALGSTLPPIQWVPGALSLGVRQPECEADHSPLASAKVKKQWIYTSLPYVSNCTINNILQIFWWLLYLKHQMQQLHSSFRVCSSKSINMQWIFLIKISACKQTCWVQLKPHMISVVFCLE
jgi:hypothetical protein